MQQLLTISIYSKKKRAQKETLLWVSESVLFLYIQTCGCLDVWEGIVVSWKLNHWLLSVEELRFRGISPWTPTEDM